MTFYRRDLPHLQRDFKAHFVTFATFRRKILPKLARDIVLECCLHDHEKKIALHAAVVMPDHVHLIFSPLTNQQEKYVYTLAEIMGGIKGASAHQINKSLGRCGRVWQDESFDHVLRSAERLEDRIQYVIENPVRRSLVSDWKDYRWLWTPEIAAGRKTGERRSPHPAEGGWATQIKQT